MKLIRAYPVSFRTRFESEGNASAEVEKRLVADGRTGRRGIECSEFIREQATQIKRNNYTAADVLPWPTYSNKSCMIPH